MAVDDTVIDYLNDNGAAFSFLTALVLAMIMAVYVFFTWRLSKSQEQATRVLAEPVLVPRVGMTDQGLRLTVRNASQAVASGVQLYTGTGSIATVREPVRHVTLLADEEAHFHLDMPAGDAADDHFKVLWGGAELLYADGHETTLIRTRIFIEEYRDPPAGDRLPHAGRRSARSV